MVELAGQEESLRARLEVKETALACDNPPLFKHVQVQGRGYNCGCVKQPSLRKQAGAEGLSEGSKKLTNWKLRRNCRTNRHNNLLKQP